MSSAAFEAVGLKCIRNEQILFKDLGFRLCSGEVLQVEGPNGSGKTSLLRILCGLVLPDAGEVAWNGRAIMDIQFEFAKEVNYIGHSNGIKSELTPLENLAVAKSLTLARKEISLAGVLTQMCLSGLADIPVRKLSSGQCRRVALSRLLISQARLWILDEPFTTLDDNGRQLVQELIVAHTEAGGIAIIVTHEPIKLPKHKLNKITL